MQDDPGLEGRDKMEKAWLQIVSTFYDKTASASDQDHAWWTIAEYVRRHLHRYNRPPYPRMPGLPTDADILKILSKSKKNAADARISNLFNAWRTAFWKQEMDARAKVEALLSAAWTMHRLGIEDHRNEIITHLEDQFDYQGTGVVPESLLDRRELALRMTRDTSVLTVDLRNGRRMERDEDKHPEDDDSFFDDLGEFGDG